MSANWSLTYLEATVTEAELFSAVVEIFRLELDGKLYGLDFSSAPHQGATTVKLSPVVAEWFDDVKRARIVTDALLERYGQGVLIYSSHNGLLTIADSVIQATDVYISSRSRRVEFAKELDERPDPQLQSLFLYMRFLKGLSGLLQAQAAHLMFERNPATRATSIHFYSNGQMVDDYYAERIGADDYTDLIELPQQSDTVRQLLDRRFSFLLEQPKQWSYVDEAPTNVYFDAENIGIRVPKYDVFNLRNSGLYVPFWEENMLPVGAVYCLNGELPDYFLKRYES